MTGDRGKQSSSAADDRVGRVTELWRYPVKSMLGQRHDTLAIEERGVVGDRLYAVRDGDGKFGSGKNTRRFRRIDGLFGFRARYEDGVPVITLPDGREVRGDDDGVHQHLQRALNRSDVSLSRERSVSHFDQAPLHVVTDASLAWLAAALPGTDIDARRLRPNLVVATGCAPGPVEDAWVGRTARIGAEVIVNFTHGTERCVMVNNAQDDLTQDHRVLKAIADANDLKLGVYATVLQSGSISLADPLHFL
ncbi:MOSC domain-containing protein [Actinomadura nitritigenes]|uniref:MOSC domain-containing protein n=1 Tax=Actinomadura nitritigenes TaxID=134602 RepID=UPI003D8EB301